MVGWWVKGGCICNCDCGFSPRKWKLTHCYGRNACRSSWQTNCWKRNNEHGLKCSYKIFILELKDHTWYIFPFDVSTTTQKRRQPVVVRPPLWSLPIVWTTECKLNGGQTAEKKLWNVSKQIGLIWLKMSQCFLFKRVEVGWLVVQMGGNNRITKYVCTYVG